MIFEKIHSGAEPGADYEQLVFCSDASVGLKAIISMHSTALGPAVGGCRMWAYASDEEALEDVLRLSKGMTYKAAISGLRWGGGKAVIIGDKKMKTPELLRRFGEYVNRLGGNYVTAKDVGIGSDDLRLIKSKTPHVLGIDGEQNSSGDPSPATAWGVYHGMLASARHALGASSLKGMKIAVQGLGSVAFSLVEHLTHDGAEIIACDVDNAAIERATQKFPKIEIVSPDSIYDVPCDIFSPCALGAAINQGTLKRLNTKVIAGAANNQLATAEDGAELMRRGITYAPDYAINAGGLINIYHEAAVEGGYSRTRAFEQVTGIEKTIAEILARASEERRPAALIADQIAEERMLKGRRAR